MFPYNIEEYNFLSEKTTKATQDYFLGLFNPITFTESVVKAQSHFFDTFEKGVAEWRSISEKQTQAVLAKIQK